MSLEFLVTVRPAAPHERGMLERIAGPLGSDAVVGVFLGSALIGWGDDYGTFHIVPDEAYTVTTELEVIGERLLTVATDLYSAYTQAKGV